MTTTKGPSDVFQLKKKTFQIRDFKIQCASFQDDFVEIADVHVQDYVKDDHTLFLNNDKILDFPSNFFKETVTYKSVTIT